MLIYIIPLSLNSIFCKTPTHQMKYSDFKKRIKLNPKFFSRWCDYSRVFCPTHKILSSLVFWFLQYIWKETKLLMHLEYLNRNSIWGEITKSLTPIYTTHWYEFFSENTIQSERHEKKTGDPEEGREEEWGGQMVKWGDFYNGSSSIASISLLARPVCTALWFNKLV